MEDKPTKFPCTCIGENNSARHNHFTQARPQQRSNKYVRPYGGKLSSGSIFTDRQSIFMGLIVLGKYLLTTVLGSCMRGSGGTNRFPSHCMLLREQY